MQEMKKGGTSNYIIYVPNVTIQTPGYLSKFFHPYREIATYISEFHICPFCGQIHDTRYSECFDYRGKISNLLEQNGAKHYKIIKERRRSAVYKRCVNDVVVKQVRKSQIMEFGPDFWDFSEFYYVCGKNGFRLANPSYDPDSKEVRFYWKNLGNKDVFLCSVPIDIEENDKIIFKSSGEDKVVLEYKDYNALVEALLNNS